VSVGVGVGEGVGAGVSVSVSVCVNVCVGVRDGCCVFSCLSSEPHLRLFDPACLRARVGRQE
jgi:hypothetical protein